ncbi:hypothetical protein ACH5RR_008140 [Cinchona calisaya]|uniref:Uncharacterized protein n=1 Tax=Cinchona calisaya TaxID=153742 RepID=A0ABD3ACE2_9GENT
MAGRVQLAQVALNTIPTYTLQNTPMPIEITKKLDQTICNFVWRQISEMSEVRYTHKFQTLRPFVPITMKDDKLKAYNYKKGLQSDLQSTIVLSQAKTYKDMYDVAMENKVDIKRKAGKESNKKMRFSAS